MFDKVKQIYKDHPLRVIIAIAFLFRLMAAIFSRGYAFTDDHFFVIEEAEQWIQGNGGFQPWWDPYITNAQRIPHSTFYTFLHFLFFQFLHFIGFESIEGKMFLVRLIHAVYSLSIVYLGFKITRKLSSIHHAIQAAWILALLWLSPFLSVRNLVEWVSIPPLLWVVYKTLENKRIQDFWLVGIVASLAFVVRYQTALFTGTLGLCILYQYGWKKGLSVLGGFFIGATLFSGLLDGFLFGQPFHELIGYVEYNMTHSGEYPNGPWYQFILVILGLFGLILPIFWAKNIAKDWRKYSVLLLPFLVFFLFHSYFPNKQERFILPIVPIWVIMGVVSTQGIKTVGYLRAKQLFWILNIPLLLVLTFSSTKTVKMDSMLYLREKGVKHFAIESSNEKQMEFIPQFYWNEWNNYQHFMPRCQAACFFDSVKVGSRPMPEMILFFNDRNLEERVSNLKKFVVIQLDTIINSSLLDQLIHKLNPIVKAPTVKIYKVLGWSRELPASAGTTSVEASTSAESTKATGSAASSEVTSPAKTTAKKDGR